MKVWQQIAFWIIGLSAWFLLISSSQDAFEELEMAGTHISFENRKDRSFLDLAEMNQLLEESLPDSSGLVSEINKALLEESLDNHPAILKAEVYSKIDGNLRIMLWQHNPLARVITKKGSFYLLDKGQKMPISPHYSEEVPLISGKLDDADLKDLAAFWSTLKTDEFYQKFFVGLHCNEQKEWTLFPRKGKFKIRIGKAEDLSEKLAKLKVFYSQAPALKDINKLIEIDLRYEGQLICRKN
ncbi:MAG: cell division protein FtsQ/DivIB [Bacteroidetes bacterium]|nr:cell division protein FtsQ/DivIB [Bacteroidota bacterium]